MAEQTVQDVVNGTQSMGALPVGVSGHTQPSSAVVQGENEGLSTSPAIEIPPASGPAPSTSPLPSELAIRPDSTDPQTPLTPAAHEPLPGWRERANSFKKPKAFQPVSVTKTFLGKVASEAHRGSDKIVEGPPSAARASPQPLVQKKTLNLKTGSSSRIATARATTPATGPDAAKVWNRNQPVAPAPPKQFTDEELKQQYGIHMATRLQADESGTQSKWADIDDDDDNWVPEGVMEWTDGTKSTLAPSKTSPEAVAQVVDSEPQITVPDAAVKPVEEPSIPSAGKTILRPGIRPTSSATGKPGLVLRGQPDGSQGPTTGAPTAATSRSPWAALPPVDKVSPVAFVPPMQSSQQTHRVRRPSQDYDVAAPYQPTRELAADDFSRWADGERHSKELYNSQSGRYEPVKHEGRRASLRADGYRRPSVLQRPSAGGSNYPEPSSAFHNRRGDARADMTEAEQRHDESAIDSTQQTPSQETLPLNDTATNTSIAGTEAEPSKPEVPVQTAPVRSAEEERAEQHRLMKERIELNRRRKLAEMEREEEARKERIRLKMKALDAEREKEAKTADREQTAGNVSHHASQSKHPSPPASHLNEQAIQAFGAKPLSDPLPPTEPHLTPPKSPKVVLAPSSVPSPGHEIPKAVALEQGAGSSPPHAIDSDASSWTSLANRHPRSSGWAGPGLPGQSANVGNVWGPPSNDRTLGNGVFESGAPNLQRSPNRSLQRTGPPPGPIGPPSTSPRVLAEGAQYQATQPPGMGTMPVPPNSTSAGAPTMRYGSGGKSHPKTDLSAVTRAWGNVQSRQAESEAKQRARQVAREAELAMNPDAPEPVPVFNVMFRKTQNGRPSNHVQHLILDENQNRFGESEPGFVAAPPGSLNSQQTVHAPIGSLPTGQPAHQSRFFGPNAQAVPPYNVLSAYPEYHSRSPSPPPPEQGQHPAYYSGNAQPRPRVSFPPGKPIVRLPPLGPAGRLGPVATAVPQRLASGGFGSPQPIAQQAAWQDRFNDLLGRTPGHVSVAMSPPTPIQLRSMATPSPAIASSSRVPLEAGPGLAAGATVSLPREKIKVSFALPDTFVESKPTEEEMMEDRGFGSLPTVSLPTDRLALEVPVAPLPPRSGGKVAHAERNFSFGSTSDVKEVESLLQAQQGGQVSVVVHLLGKAEVIKTLARKPESTLKKRRPNDKRKTSASGSAQTSDPGSLSSPIQHSPPNEKENGERRSKWTKGTSRKKFEERFDQQTNPAGLARDAATSLGSPGEASGKRGEARKKSSWAKPARSVSNRAP